MRLPRFLRYLRFQRRISQRLPEYHPQTGQRLHWSVSISYTNIEGYDQKTGKRIGGYPMLVIVQRSPTGNSIDPNVYEYDWKAKAIIKVANGVWQRS
jgi:hypothetical protein